MINIVDLHSEIRAELDRRLKVAKAAAQWLREREGNPTPYWVDATWQWTAAMPGPLGALFGLHDPADSIRRYESAFRVLERHAPIAELVAGTHLWCNYCDDAVNWPCDDILDLAASLGLESEKL